MKVSVIIKALNEERNIIRAIESALIAIDKVGGEVILADSLSTDHTVEYFTVHKVCELFSLCTTGFLHYQMHCFGVKCGFVHEDHHSR